MNNQENPEFIKDAFNCPRCGAYAKQHWAALQSIDYNSAAFGRHQLVGKFDEFVASMCDRCKKFSIWSVDKESLVIPKTSMRNYDLVNIPKDMAEDYTEACLVLSESPKASAALSRRCLQAILREKGFNEKSLAQEIQKAIDSNTLPPYIAEPLDAIRNIGNFAAHPIKATNSGEIIEVEPGEADWNLDVIEALFDFYFDQPVKMQAKKDALNAKLNSAGKPNMK